MNVPKLGVQITAAASTVWLALGHGAVSIPRPRNAIDGNVYPWNSTVPEEMPFMFWCTIPSTDTNDPRNVTGKNGQVGVKQCN